MSKYHTFVLIFDELFVLIKLSRTSVFTRIKYISIFYNIHKILENSVPPTKYFHFYDCRIEGGGKEDKCSS